MLVKQRMSRHPITVRSKTSLHDALRVMRDNKVRRLPVLDEKNKLVGIVSEKQLLYASPSPATATEKPARSRKGARWPVMA